MEGNGDRMHDPALQTPARPRANPAPHVVIIGGGFGGMSAARALKRAPVRVTLIDRRNHHLFQPLLYQVALAALNPSDIASPIRRILRRQKNAEVLLGEVSAIDLERQIVRLGDLVDDSADIHYDYLIVAAGATHSYFGHDDWAPFAPGLKTVEDALEIRRRILLAFEAAELETDPDRRRAWMTFVVVGGGPTGVELAGTLSNVARFTLAKDFRHIDPRHTRVLLLEGSPRVLSPFPEALSAKAKTQLEQLGVEVHAGKHVTDIDPNGVQVGDERITARTVLWAAGVTASPLAKSLGVPLDRAGRVFVEPDLSVPGHPEVFVVGDLANLSQDGKPVPGLAPAALQEGRHAAGNILRVVKGTPSKPFHYTDKGQLATIGRGAGVADVGRFQFSGWIAWLFWSFVHIFFLIGFRNRMLVLMQWSWAYFTYDRGARLITGPITRSPEASDAEVRGRHPRG